MRLADFISVLGLDAAVADFVRDNDFEAAEAEFVFPPPGLTEPVLRQRLSMLGMDCDIAPLLKAAERVLASEALSHLFHYLSFYWWRGEARELYRYKLPRFSDYLDEDDASLLELAVALEGIPAIRKAFSRQGIPVEYADAALSRIPLSVAGCARHHGGKPGYSESEHHWMRHFVDGELFRIGRLEYMVAEKGVEFPLALGPCFYRRKTDGAVIGLCREGWRLDADGGRTPEGEEPVRVAHLVEDGACVRGIPVNPCGHAEVQRELVLSLDDYEPMWSKGDLVPDIHIPGGGGLKPELCRASLAEACDFFMRYFHREVKGFTSFSWIYNPDLERLLPHSNVASFMRELYLSPMVPRGDEGLSFVFGKSAADWSGFPRDTAMRDAFHKIREAGGRLRNGGAVIEKRAIQEYGTSLYRKEFANVLR